METIGNVLAMFLGLVIGIWSLQALVIFGATKIFPKLADEIPILSDIGNAFSAFWEVAKPFASIIIPVIVVVMLAVHVGVYAIAGGFFTPLIWELSAAAVVILVGLAAAFVGLSKHK